MPSTEDELKDIANKTFQEWPFPNCFAAADGKHIPLMHPHNSGSLYINYKRFFSIVVTDLADYDYKFLFIDIGCQGRISDGGFFGIVTSMEHLFATNSTFHYQLKYHH